MSAIRPWNTEHGNAVVQAGFGVVFRDFPTYEQVRDLAQLHSEFKESHPRLRIAVARGWHKPPQDGLPPLDGFVFDNETADVNTVREIKIGALSEEDYALIVIRSGYTRWERVWKEEVRPIFRTCLSCFPDNLPISRVELRLFNRFVGGEAPREFDLEKVFRPDSVKWFALGGSSPGSVQYTYKENDGDRGKRFSHSGTIEMRVRPITYPGPDKGSWVEVELNLAEKVTESSKNLNGKTMVSGSTLDDLMDDMHDRCRSLLMCLLNDEMRDAINLKD